MTRPDLSPQKLSLIATARTLEVEAIEGGPARHELNFSPSPDQVENEEERPMHGRDMNSIDETLERSRTLSRFINHAAKAFRQRGLVYPFRVSDTGDCLEVMPGQRELANKSAWFSEIVGQGANRAKDFEERAFRALHHLIGGWGICVGAKRRSVGATRKAIDRFRHRLNPWERGSFCPEIKPRSSGDVGADGFVILGRAWGGPIVFYQAKNTEFDMRNYPEELARMPDVLRDWFGRQYSSRRAIIPVLALNTVLTLEMKEDIFHRRGVAGVHMLDVVDIMCSESVDGRHNVRRSRCEIF